MYLQIENRKMLTKHWKRVAVQIDDFLLYVPLIKIKWEKKKINYRHIISLSSKKQTNNQTNKKTTGNTINNVGESLFGNTQRNK